MTSGRFPVRFQRILLDCRSEGCCCVTRRYEGNPLGTQESFDQIDLDLITRPEHPDERSRVLSLMSHSVRQGG